VTALPALAACTYLEARRLARDRRAVVLLPLGAVEQHGPHLPLLVDWLGAEELARLLAPRLRRAGFLPVLAPSLPYGVSPLAEGWPGTVSLSSATFRRVVVEVLDGLAGHGFRRFVLANYQADPGQLRALRGILGVTNRNGRRVLVAGFTPDRRAAAAMFDPRVTALLRSPRPDAEWHAGELETAMVLAARPSLVRRAVARRLPPVWIDVRRALAAGARTFRELDPRGRGYFGWPAAARASTARAAMALRARLIADALVAELGAASPPRPRPRSGAGRARGGP
jgi:creatinine amidohydrolase